MTTKAAAALYEAQRVFKHEGRKTAMHNPYDKPIKELPVIYGFNNGGNSSMLSGVLLAEDGTQLGGHICSSEAYMPADLGVLENTRLDRHETFKEHYPNGYRMEFVGYDDFSAHDGLKVAVKLAEIK